MTLKLRDGQLLLTSDGMLRECGGPDCCGAQPGPQPCATACNVCQSGTKPRRVKITVSGVVEKPGYTPFGNWPRYNADCDGDDEGHVCDVRGDETTDIYGCNAWNKTYLFGCDTDGTGCQNQPCGSSTCMPIWAGQCSSQTCDSACIGFSFFPRTVGGISIPLPYVSIEYGSMPPLGPGQPCSGSDPPNGETGAGAFFVGDGPTSGPYDCSAHLGTLSQYLVESSWCPCDFSNAVVTIEVLEYAHVLPTTLYLSVLNSTCLDDDSGDEIPLVYNAGSNRYVGTIHCGDQTLNVWFNCITPPSNLNLCRSPNDPVAQGVWQLQIFDGVTPPDSTNCWIGSFGETTNYSTSQDPFYWESNADPSVTGCCECTSGTGIRFAVSE